MRAGHIQSDLLKSDFTIDLYKQYRKHLGLFRFRLLIEGQILVVPKKVNELLKLGRISFLTPVLGLYKLLRSLKLDWLLKAAILPKEYHREIKELDVV
jgi:hypothetical protein